MVGVLPEKIDLDIYQGDDFYMTIWVTDPNTGVLVDLTGYTFRSQIRPTTDSDVILALFQFSVGGTGKVDLHLPSTDTETLPVGHSVWDFEMTNPSGTGQVMTPCAGVVNVTAQVTR
jgi:hypothetical protein